MGVFSKMQQMCKIYDTVFFDIDAASIDVAAGYAHTVIDTMKSAFRDVNPRMYFSSGKGYHLYYDIVPTYLESYNAAVHNIVHRLKIQACVDTQVLSSSILCRVPYTMHMKTHKYCIPIFARHISNFDMLEQMSRAPRLQDFRLNPSRMLADALRNEMKTMNANATVRTVNDGAALVDDPVPLCVSSSYDRLINGTAEHVDRVFLAMYMLNSGAGVECAMSAFKAAPDFVPRQTHYQLHYTDRKKVKVYSCRTLIRQGVCPLDADTRCLCAWYPNIYRTLQTRQCSIECIQHDR